MRPLKSANRLSICSSCHRISLRVGIRTASYSAGRSRSTVPQRKEKEHVKSSPSDETSNERTGPRTVGWTSLLKTSYLGRTASVLVLRDSEEKSRGKNGYTLQEKQLQDVNVDELMRSVDAQKNVSGQAEVNHSIDAYRPQASEQKGAVVITDARFNELVEDIGQSFNQQQLSRYIGIKEGERLLECDTKTQIMGKTQNDMQLIRSEWCPVHSSSDRKPSRRLPVYKGKRNLVNIILRSVWGIKIAEETRWLGSLTLNLRSGTFMLLSTGSESDLARISRMFNVSVEVSSSQKDLTIYGDRSSCLLAAESIDNQLDQVCHTHIDLRPLLKHTDISISDTVRSLTAETKAVAELVDFDQSLMIQAKEQAEVNQYRRVLLSSLGLQASLHTCVVSDESENCAEGVLMASPIDTRPNGTTEARKRIARFSSIQHIAKDDSSSRTDFHFAHLKSCFDRALDQLRLYDSNIAGATPTYIAEIGETRFEMRHDSNFEPCPLSQLADLVNIQKPSFSHVAPGLSHLLLHKISNPPDSRKNSIRVKLTPSPWHEDQGLKSTSRSLPHLMVELDIEPQSKSTQLRALSASGLIHEAHMLLPRLSTDVMIKRSDHIELPHAELGPEIARYIREVQASADGYSKVNAPPNLRVGLPSSLLREAGNAEVAQNIDVEYHTSSIAFVHEIEFDLDGFKLVCCRQTGDLGVKTEKVFLRIGDAFSSSEALQSRSSGLSDETREQFFTTLCTVLKWLNVGAGNTSLLFQDSSSIFRKLQRSYNHVDLSDSTLKNDSSLLQQPPGATDIST